MKLIRIILAIVISSTFLYSCNETKKAKIEDVDTETTCETPDSTIYGVCGEGTAMNTLQLITDLGDTLEYSLLDNDDNPVNVQGGLMAGDRMAVMGTTVSDTRIATTVINITTLLGKWTSIDKNFEIQEGGLVKSNVKAENNSWTSWKILNGRLLLNKDTFIVNTLGADSLYLENDTGIFVYKRQLK
ncbi:MAG: hypothetical protein ACI3YB_03180 [Prevotella sp.]